MTTADWDFATKLEALMRMPWTVRVGRDPDDDANLVARVDELPDAIATGDGHRALAADLFESIRASLLVRLEHGDPITLPPRQTIPWESGRRPSAIAYFEERRFVHQPRPAIYTTVAASLVVALG